MHVLPAQPRVVATPKAVSTLESLHELSTKELMTNLSVFAFESQEIRIVFVDGQPWWIASDICSVLEIQNVSQAMEKLDSDERSMFNIGRQGSVNIVNEPGMYSLVLTSRKPQAKAFKRWLTHEVIPSIRKTGSYSLPQKESLPSRLLAMETAQAIASINNFVGDNPRLAQILTDIAMNDAIALIGGSGTTGNPLRGVAEIAQDMGYSVTPGNRVSLGKFVRSQLTTGVKEKRLCNGTQREIWCYPDCEETRNAVSLFFK